MATYLRTWNSLFNLPSPRSLEPSLNWGAASHSRGKHRTLTLRWSSPSCQQSLRTPFFTIRGPVICRRYICNVFLCFKNEEYMVSYPIMGFLNCRMADCGPAIPWCTRDVRSWNLGGHLRTNVWCFIATSFWEICYDIFKLFRALFTTYVFHTFATSELC